VAKTLITAQALASSSSSSSWISSAPI